MHNLVISYYEVSALANHLPTRIRSGALVISGGEGSFSRNTRREGVIKHQQRRRSTAATSIDDGEAADGRQRSKTSRLIPRRLCDNDACPRCIIVRLTGPYGQDLPWTSGLVNIPT